MRTWVKLSSVMLLCSVIAATGCGGGGDSSISGRTGSILVSVIFPDRPAEVNAQALPVATNSVRVQVLNPDDLTPIVPDQIVARAGGGERTFTLFDQVPIGPCLVRALAYESFDGTGRVIAQAEVLTTIVAGEQTNVILITEALVVRVVVLPETLALDYTQEATLSATCYDADDNIVITPVAWTSSSANVPVDAAGKVTGANEGSAVVTATHEESGLSDSCDVTVTRRRVDHVVVTPAKATLHPPDTHQVQLAAVAYDALGDVIPYATITWTSDSPAVTVDQNGLVSSNSPIQLKAMVTASAGEGTDGTSEITVAPVGKLDVEVR